MLDVICSSTVDVLKYESIRKCSAREFSSIELEGKVCRKLIRDKLFKIEN